MTVKLRSVSTLSLATLASLTTATLSHLALADVPDIEPLEEASRGEDINIPQQTFLAQSLISRLKNDGEFRKTYFADPRQAMTSLGIHPEVQREVLLGQGLIQEGDTELEGDCTCTGCCVTSVNF